MPRLWLSFFLTLAVCFSGFEAITIFRPAQRISNNFKQLNLSPEEIDPNVAPPESIINGDQDDYIYFNSGTTGATQSSELIDDSINEISLASPPAVTPLITATTPATLLNSTPTKNTNDSGGLVKFCKCTENHCDCCRDFNLPFIPIKGPGCAKITYLGDEKMSVTLKYGDLTLASRTISSKKARPFCVGLPGGYSKFCGRIYGLSKAKRNFKACLGFELRADDEIEAALRVSCFKFGPEGLRVAEAEPFPTPVKKEDDDDDDIFGFGAGGDEDDDEDDYDEEENDEADADADYAEDEDDDNDNEEAPADADYGGFSLGGLFDDDDSDDESDNDSKPAEVTALSTPSSRITDVAQSKNEVGTLAAQIPAASKAGSNKVNELYNKANSSMNLKVKTKSKILKKHKKKKSADISESDYALAFINGLLNLFN
ncbi:uncharacterized protein LOC119637266 isoform X1 [Glossina fuscipes]|uniref:Uncharacterized protein LOC119637266 isoform X1 n=1 Tax=Glossina fuscipes TaxID=7396 RepID=A0A9C5YWN2_9MUSC|nr:uncharacterized protein LOC119637266 isoform X1 [Glossina fuscipes]XP_037889086.1 uncharacterized protein LOC119637266 isoform X1 [Glossina fuscipes]KAI9582071.1 hypothetical protein GQX74_011566 [Glossina fuscipes]